MSLGHKYQNFNTFTSVSAVISEASEEALEDQKLQSFEEGYQAGWDDAVKAQSDDKTRVSAQLDQSLQEMSFTYHEALAKLTNAMKPLMEQIVDKLLPTVARETLGAHVIEQTLDMLRDSKGHAVEIVVAKDSLPAIEALLTRELKDPFSLIGEASLSSGQAFVRIGQQEREIDVDAVVAGISDAVTAFFHHASEDKKYG
jgi:flagellar assembly protein FliH